MISSVCIVYLYLKDEFHDSIVIVQRPMIDQEFVYVILKTACLGGLSSVRKSETNTTTFIVIGCL